MSPSDADWSWLPDYQLQVVATLAHVDHTIDRLLQLTHDYSAQGPVTFDEVIRGDRADVVVKAVAPLPQAVARLVADALTQLRAALEHTLYAEVEAGLERPLTEEEARGVEMPTATDAGALARWFRDGRRRRLPPLHVGTPLAQRIERLQPFQRRDPDEHSLRLLAVYTNLAKHRAPVLLEPRLGAVYPDDPHSDLTVALPLQRDPQPGDGLPLREGDVLASAPRGSRIPFSVVTTVSLQRPHTGVWAIAARELQGLEEWVRTVAVPVLITGGHDVSPLPPHLDIAIGHGDLRGELETAGLAPAAVRAGERIAAVVARVGLIEVLAPFPEGPETETVRVWLDSLDDQEVLERALRLQRVREQPHELVELCSVLIAEAVSHRERNLQHLRADGEGA
ncbi:hypothetical protein [Streptomyces regalis]|uniref:Uncharacterized protein n=1 Tax=Streptomyces regalis TaxID=68262 RepID=A0A0X3UZC0_9ACTN|nr:hypothetical protein [Streptomyces regalis]KUL37252.1 hypothetical protein ADL12_18275 [Streptomyces regalis]